MKEWRKFFISVLCWCENDDTAAAAEVREKKKIYKTKEEVKERREKVDALWKF